MEASRKSMALIQRFGMCKTRIRENMKVEQQIPLLLVERQALVEAMEGEKNGHHHIAETRGLCLSEEQTMSMARESATIKQH